MRTIKFLLAILFGIALAACGGGGNSSSGSGSSPATYGISGTVTSSGVALSGVTVTLLAGGATTTTTTDAGGNYSFTGLANGNYTVIPARTGYAFSPTSSAVSVSGANVTATNFTATLAATTYSISGMIIGATGVKITLNGANAGAVVTGALGTYTITGLVPGSYTVTPSLSGFTFTPISKPITIVNESSTANDFVATAIPVSHIISGTVSGAILSGVTITATGTAAATATTDASGNYSVTGLYDGGYTVTPSKSGYTFSPNSMAVTMNGTDVTSKNFTATTNVAPTYTLSGTVTGAWVENVMITLSGAASATTTTDASGNYSFKNLPAGSYTLTPFLAGYIYSPSAPTIAVSANMAQNFVASSAIASYSISGTVSYAGAKTGAMAIRAICNGNSCGSTGGAVIAAPGGYTIRGLQNGSYVVAAEMDALGTGNSNATNPQGISTTITVASSNLTGVGVVVADPVTPAPVTPILQGVFPGNSSAFISYNPPMNAIGQEIATSYKLYWGTDATASNGGSTTYTANGDRTNAYFLSGLSNGVSLYFKMSALVGATESAKSAAVGPVTIGATTGANTVSGTVTFPGTVTGPMWGGAYNDNGVVYLTGITNPVSPQSYSVSGVPSGSYQSFAVIDMNNNGMVDNGDISNANSNATAVTVSGNTTSNLTLTSAYATTSVSAGYRYDGSISSIIPKINDGTKHAVAATLISASNVPVPFDMVIDLSSSTWISLSTTSPPTVRGAYMFKVTFSDGTTQIISCYVP